MSLPVLNLLPPVIDWSVGVEGAIMWENTLRDDATDYRWSIACPQLSSTRVMQDRWAWTPTTAFTNKAFTLNRFLKLPRTLDQACSSAIRFTGAKPGVTLIVNAAGESPPTANAYYLTGVAQLCANLPGGIAVQFSGTQTSVPTGLFYFAVSGVSIAPNISATYRDANGNEVLVLAMDTPRGTAKLVCSGTVNPPASGVLTAVTKAFGDATISYSSVAGQAWTIKNEGRSGWSAAQFAMVGSPYWNPAANSGAGGLDYNHYLTTNSLPVPNVQTWMLGANGGLLGASDDATALSVTASDLAATDLLLGMIQAYNANYGASVQVAFLPWTPPSWSEDAAGISYGTLDNRFQCKANWAIFNSALIAHYAGQEASGVFVGATHLPLDVRRDMQWGTPIPRNAYDPTLYNPQSNLLHHGPLGGASVGGAFYALLNYMAP